MSYAGQFWQGLSTAVSGIVTFGRFLNTYVERIKEHSTVFNAIKTGVTLGTPLKMV